jgi:UDP-N-acetylglucosamine 2-epimerase (non-hydrolysing)
MGTNELVGTKPENLKPYLEKVLSENWKKGGKIPLWDGKTSERIVDSLLKIYSKAEILEV